MPLTSTTLASFVNGFVHPSKLATVNYSRKKDAETLARKEKIEGILNEIKWEDEDDVDVDVRWSLRDLSKHPETLWRTLFPCIAELEDAHPGVKFMHSGTSDGYGIHLLFADENRLKHVLSVEKSVSKLAGKRIAKASAEDPECKDGLRSITSHKGIINVDQAFREGKLEHGEEELENLVDHPVICGDLGMCHSHCS
jgi:hypothetical protein